MDKRKVSHDILNLLERLRIMHDLIRDKKFDDISKEELESDLQESLQELQKNFDQVIQ